MAWKGRFEVTREELMRRVSEVYDVEPDYPFSGDDVSAVFRHAPSRKWFALVMRVPARALGMEGEEALDVVNLKCDPLLAGALRSLPGIFPAYHMNKEHWISVVLREVGEEEVMGLVEESYRGTGRR